MIFKLIQQGVIAIVIVGACAFAWASVAPAPSSGGKYAAGYDSPRHDKARYGHSREHGGWVPAHAGCQDRSFPAYQDRD